MVLYLIDTTLKFLVPYHIELNIGMLIIQNNGVHYKLLYYYKSSQFVVRYNYYYFSSEDWFKK